MSTNTKPKPMQTHHWANDRGPLCLCIDSPIDAAIARDAIEASDAYRLLDIIRRNCLDDDGEVAA